ncbi:LysM peptidoglycan-binding domain-containing protein [Vulcaniibacterium tengchongense]|uniref:LysM domain-containing protein n=1 Tax=Vulcaniibacterium tengchongense TaxID=1273429 RepID=A0A3N4UYT1_9GAMM|nr:LysM domain-containing protein [Vulcaniibacterium tengchongense]RPE75882.1 LysM domain-containing protein [Vulcaniibacterium tengchongense]
MSGGMREFLAAVAQRESGNDHTIINRAGFVGKYQFGEAALIDLGYYKSDGSNYVNNWKGVWTGKNGINSLQDFRNSPDVQDLAGAEWFKILCKRARLMGLDQYIGKTIKGIQITESGILAGAHLVGMGTKKKPAGVGQFLLSNGQDDPVDGFGTRASEYISKFGGYNLGCHAGTLSIAIQDRKREPIPNVGYEVRGRGTILQKGTTNRQGEIQKPLELDFSDSVEFWIERIQGGFKKIWAGVMGSSEHKVVLRSPKVKVTGRTKAHTGAEGTHGNRTQQARQSGIHVVKRGDSLWAIAKRHGTTVEELRKINPELGNSDLIHPGQSIAVRSGGSSVVVKPGETLSRIAQRNNTTVADLQRANPSITDPDRIQAGQPIRIPDASAATDGAKVSSPASASAPSQPSEAPSVITTKNDRTRRGHPITVATENPPPPAVTDRVKRMIEILDMNVLYGDPKVKPNGPAAAARAIRNQPISTTPKRARRSLGRCYLYVKVALQASGMASRYLAGQAAKSAGPELKKEGFRNILEESNHGIKSPYDAPVGSVIVYDVTDGSPWGHIEVRMSDGEFASDYKSPNSRVMRVGEPPTLMGRGRRVSGIWVKE